MPPKQRFIPGLNSRPDDIEMPPRPQEKTDIDILFEEFTKAKKNAAMCLHEYCQKEKIELKFKEGPVQFKPGQPRTFGSFGCYAIVSGKQYEQGVGSNKKEAKTEASKLCLRVLFGLSEFNAEEEQGEIDDNRFVEVRDLLDICAAQDISYEKMMSQDAKGHHTCSIFLAHYDPIRHTSPDREEAVVLAHRTAIEILRGYKAAPASHNGGATSAAAAPVHQTSPRVPNSQAGLQREGQVYEALRRTLETPPPELSGYDHHIAAIFQASKRETGIGKIVAFGTGNSSLGVEHLTSDGRCVGDSSALTVARRAFKRYIAAELLSGYTNKASIFEPHPDVPGQLRIMSGIEFDLFLSHPPEGDYADFLTFPSQFSEQELEDIARGAHCPNFTDDTHGMFRCRNEHGMVEPSQQCPSQLSQQQVKMSNELWIMTESDKLLRWNILGLQGAVLSLFTGPIYLRSISIGLHRGCDHGHLCRAVCCRVYPELQAEFPPHAGFIINHPALTFCVTSDLRNKYCPGARRSPHSLNWNCNDTRAELNDCITGRSNPASPFQVSSTPLSRQCKAGLHLKWFKELAQFGPPQVKGCSPAEVKAAAKDYQLVKAAFLRHCVENGIGEWRHLPQGVWTLGTGQ